MTKRAVTVSAKRRWASIQDTAEYIAQIDGVLIAPCDTYGRVEANPLKAHVEGLYVRSYEDEAARMVLTWRGWVRLGESYLWAGDAA